MDSPRSEKKSVPFRVEKLNFLRKLWSLAFLAKKLVLISFFFLSTKTTNFNSKKIQIFQRTKKFKKIFFWRLNSYLYIYIDYYEFIWEVLWLNFPKCDQNKMLNSVAGLRLAAIFIFIAFLSLSRWAEFESSFTFFVFVATLEAYDREYGLS